MWLVNHENRYVYDRMIHIVWILFIFAVLQYHMLHISSIAYVSKPSHNLLD